MGDSIDMSQKKSPCVQNYKYTIAKYALGAGVT